MDELPTRSPYETLGIPKDATLATVRSAYRKLVLSCHPDKVQDPAEKLVKAEHFHELQKAYETLNDERKRQRYDEDVKLAELKKEMQNERSAPRRPDDYFGPPRASPRYETYENGVRYQRAEPPISGRYERDAYAAEYPEDRAPSRKYEDHYAPTSRKTSGRVPEDKRKTREPEDERERERRRKDNAKEAYLQESRKRDKDRRKDSEMKSSRKFSYGANEESDSEVDKYYSVKRESLPKHRYEDVRRRSVDDPPRKSSRREGREYDDSELESKTGAAREYMNKSREAFELDPPRRPAYARASSKLDIRTPPPPPRASAEPERRSSGRARGASRAQSPIRSSKKDRRTPEIVDSPSSRKASVPGSSPFTKAVKSVINPASSSRKGPQRSATYQNATEFRPKPLTRSETMPVDRMQRGDRGEPRPLQSSNLKNMKAPSDYSDSSSESDSEITEDMPSMRPRPRPSQHQTSTRYQYTGDDNHYVLEPEIIQPRKSDDIHSSRRASERPPMPRGSTTRAPPIGRSTSHIYTPEDRSPRQSYSRTESTRAPPLKNHQSANNSSKLFGEYAAPDEESPRSKHSPKMYSDEGRYSRRGSGDVADKDAWPGKFKSRPHTARNEPTAI